ncbi:MAG: hypothetical protein HZB61_01595 [Nitrospirae bacterium]|nr:hypothetical protein [Nitrospirota bacterium]
MPSADILASKALETIPRILGLCDRKENSPTLGCCDRTYWHYRLIDIPNARYQEAGLLFALAYSVKLPGNFFYGSAMLKTWTKDIWRFWLRRRNRDGSTNEVYPYERSFCSTAFSTAAFVETVLMQGGAEEWEEEIKECESTVLWLYRNRNEEVVNQMAASLLALTGFSVLTGDNRFAGMARERRDNVISLADNNGIFPEYGGFDAGYQSITMSALARTIALSGGDGDLEEILRKGERFLSGKIDHDGRTDPSKNSRDTQYIYPYALAVMKSELLDRLTRGIEGGTVLNPTWMDDRYCIAFAIDYLLSAEELVKC